MMLNDITSQVGRRRKRKRVGRGESSGWGKTATRGHKGCQSRSGYSIRLMSEGGQMPIFRRLPKRGFSNFNYETRYEVVNLREIEKAFADGETVDLDALRRTRLVRGGSDALVKLLADGELSKKLTVTVHAASAKARAAVEKAGGTLNLVERKSAAEKAAAKRSKQRPTRAKAAPEASAAAPAATEAPPAADAPTSDEAKKDE